MSDYFHNHESKKRTRLWRAPCASVCAVMQCEETPGGVMPRPRKLPSVEKLQRLVECGLTHDQIQVAIETLTGEEVARSSIASALHRAGLTEPQARYAREIPWRVRPEHAAAYPARMLRNLGRVRAGGVLPDTEQARFDSWLAMIERERVVVAYDPDSPEGFSYVAPDQPGDFPDGTPIRPRVWREPHNGAHTPEPDAAHPDPAVQRILDMRREQGLPPEIEDPAVLALIASIIHACTAATEEKP